MSQLKASARRRHFFCSPAFSGAFGRTLKWQTAVLPGICVAILFALTHADIAKAQAYSWLDEEGTRIYGTNPPANARSLTKMQTRKLSRYSSSKVLKRMGHTPANSTAERARLDSGPAQDGHDGTWSFVALDLKPETPSLKQDAAKKLSDCRVFIENPHDQVAGDVSVAFEFWDGSLIPAEGPLEIPPQTSAEYKVPGDLLPLSVQTQGDEQTIPAPKVVVHAFRR